MTLPPPDDPAANRHKEMPAMEAFNYLMYPIIVVGSIALRAYWIATGAEFWPSVGWESLQLLFFTCLWLSGAKHFRKDPPEKDQSQPPTTSSTP